MNFAQRLLRRTQMWWDAPDVDVRADYEALIRLARRCAYDFSHAADFLPTKENPTPYAPLGVDWHGRAQMWKGLFTKGNPGKDYRHELAVRCDRLEVACNAMREVLEEAGLEAKIPAAIYDLFMPF